VPARRGSTSPPIVFFLVLPYGISAGFISVTIPFVLTQAGFSVAAAATIVAAGISANLWRFLWGPVADLTLTLHRWYLIGVTLAAASLLAMSLVPLQPGETARASALVFLVTVAATLVVLPVGGMMAHTVADDCKGRASGWYQAGNLGGMFGGGGAGVWLAHHFSVAVSGGVLAAVMMACAGALAFVPDVRPREGELISSRMREMGRDFLVMLRSPLYLFVIVIVSSPVGSGAASGLWSAVAPDWRVSPDRVALVTGVLSGVVSAVGCVIGGWMCDRIGRWWSFFGSGAAMAVTTALMALAPRTPGAYDAGVLAYALWTGWVYAAYTALLLFVVQRGAASTKYATLSSLGNLPTTYMTAFDGWAHDRYGAGGMLNAESMLGAGAVVIGLAWLGGLNARLRGHRPGN
jgi:PAT family beta-lactamase induction signal transducer AmpG